MCSPRNCWLVQGTKFPVERPVPAQCRRGGWSQGPSSGGGNTFAHLLAGLQKISPSTTLRWGQPLMTRGPGWGSPRARAAGPCRPWGREFLQAQRCICNPVLSSAGSARSISANSIPAHCTWAWFDSNIRSCTISTVLLLSFRNWVTAKIWSEQSQIQWSRCNQRAAPAVFARSRSSPLYSPSELNSAISCSRLFCRLRQRQLGLRQYHIASIIFPKFDLGNRSTAGLWGFAGSAPKVSLCVVSVYESPSSH